jgi:hypothetical protein
MYMLALDVILSERSEAKDLDPAVKTGRAVRRTSND